MGKSSLISTAHQPARRPHVVARCGKSKNATMPTWTTLTSFKTDRATILLPKGVQREQYRGADWL